MRALLQFYRFVFYWGYSWALRTYGPANTPDMSGFFAAACCLNINIFSLLLTTGWLANVNVMEPELSKGKLVLLAVILILPQYLYLVHDGRYRRIAASFDLWPAERRRRYGRWAWAYVLGSVLALGLAAYLGKNFPNPLHLHSAT